MNRISLIRGRIARIAVACTFVACAVLVQADVKIVSKMTMHMSMANQPPQTLTGTSYYKNGMVRVDSSMGPTILMDSKNHKTYMLDANTKSYSEMSMDAMMGGPEKSILKDMKMTMSARLKPTNKTMTIAGKAAKMYIIDMVMKMNIPSMGTQPSPGSMNMTMHMEQWTTTALKQKYSTSQMMGAMSQMLKGLSMLGDTTQLVKEFSKMKGLPLNNNVTMTMVMKPSKGQPAPPSGTPMSFNMSMNTAVQSISEAPLSAALFKIPAGYKKSDHPMVPTRPGAIN